MPVAEPRPRSARRRRRPIPGAILWAMLAVCAAPAWSASPGQEALDRGAERYRNGRFQEAVEAFQEATRRDPGLLKAWENLGWAHRRLGQDEEAIRIWETVLKIEPDTVDVINELGAIHAERKAWDRALTKYQESLRLFPDQPAILFRVGEIHQALGHGAEASRHYHAAELAYLRALETDPIDSGSLADLGWATRKQGKPQHAIAAWTRAIALNPDLDPLYRHLADASFEIGDAASARGWYEKAWAAGPRMPQIAYRLADLAFQAGRDDEALAWLDRLFQLPDAARGWSLRVATLFVRHQRVPQGKAWFEQRLKASRRNGPIKRALGRLYASEASQVYQANRLEEAINGYQHALRYDPQAAGALRDLGWAYWRTAQWARCEEVWTRYAELYPKDVAPRNLLTQLSLAKRDYPGAMRSIQASLRLSPDQPGEKLKLAKALFWDGQFERAKRDARALAGEYPNDLAVQYFWGEMLMQYHDYRAGEAQWRKVLALGSDSPRARYYLILSQYGLGKYDAAVGAAKEMIVKGGPEPALLRFLIDDALIRDDLAEAVRWYELAVQRFPERPVFWTELARLYRERGLLAASEATLEQARLHHPEHLEVLIGAADGHRLDKRFDEASREYAALFARYPRNRRVFIGLLNTLVEAGRPQEALDLLERNRATFLKDYEVQLQRGRILLAQGRTADAQTLFTRVASPAVQYVPILLYHGLGEHPRSANLPVALFESHLRALRDAGYTAVTVRELAEMMEGRRRFPSRPIVITFDDARIDSFQLGDPVLAKYGMKATMFVPTARILDDHPFFADWDMVRRYAGTGRWDLQAHGHRAHDLIPIDETEQMGGFLVNRQWLEGQERLETEEEYVARLEADYRDASRVLTRRVPGLRVVGYAFPFSEAGQESVGNEPNAAEVNERLLFRSFRYGFVQDQSGYNEVGSTAPTMLRRFNVPRAWNGAKLLRHLAAHHPRHVARLQLGKSWAWSGRYERSRAVFQGLIAETPLLKRETEYQLAGVAFRQGRFREAQRHLETAMLYGERSGEGQRLMTRILWENQPRLDHRTGVFHDSSGRVNRWDALQLRFPLTPPITFWTEVGLIRFAETGLPDLSGREASVGAEWRGADRLAVLAHVRSRFIDKGANSVNAWLEGVYGSDLHEVRLQWASEDVDTVRAHAIGLRSRGYAASYLVRPAPEWNGSLFGSFRSYGDGNARVDLRAAVTHVVRPSPHWRLGLGLSRSDTRAQSTLYYTPEELIVGRGIVSYRRRWESGWEVSGETGFGWADDALRGDRLVSNAALDAVQAWSARLQSRLGWDYSRSPGYQSWLLEGSVALRF